MKKLTHADRREKHRFDLDMTVHFRLSLNGSISRWGVGTVHDISSSGMSFRCRRELPVGGRLELIIDWPAARRDQFPMSLHASGIVLRSRGSKSAIRITSHRFEVETGTSMAATA